MLPMREIREEKLIKSVVVRFLIYKHKRKSDSLMELMANILSVMFIRIGHLLQYFGDINAYICSVVI